LGLDASEADLATSLALAAKQPLVKGFAIGRTIFGDAARAWLKGDMIDAAAVAQMSDRYARLAALWDQARMGGKK
jgi:5-dehydro-2-deoxygluconokinase